MKVVQIHPRGVAGYFSPPLLSLFPTLRCSHFYYFAWVSDARRNPRCKNELWPVFLFVEIALDNDLLWPAAVSGFEFVIRQDLNSLFDA